MQISILILGVLLTLMFLIKKRFTKSLLKTDENQLTLDIQSPLAALKMAQDEAQCFDYVFIDDDKILRNGWEKRALKLSLKLLTLSSTSEFIAHSHSISKEKTKIFIDSNLGEGEMRGEDFLVLLHQEGFKNLFIASGYESSKFSHLPWLKHSGKDCPF